MLNLPVTNYEKLLFVKAKNFFAATTTTKRKHNELSEIDTENALGD